jgi:hypothetical protein
MELLLTLLAWQIVLPGMTLAMTHGPKSKKKFLVTQIQTILQIFTKSQKFQKT